MPAERGPAFPLGKERLAYRTPHTRPIPDLGEFELSRKLGGFENAGLEPSDVVNARGLTPKVA